MSKNAPIYNSLLVKLKKKHLKTTVGETSQSLALEAVEQPVEMKVYLGTSLDFHCMSFKASKYLVSSLRIGQLHSDAGFNYDSSQTPQGLTAKRLSEATD